jgi:hypothetical protein
MRCAMINSSNKQNFEENRQIPKSQNESCSSNE